MIVTLDRYGPGSKYPPGDDSTVGLLTVPGAVTCYTLEDQYQAEKVYGETRIPAGTYRLSLHKASRFDASYRKRFPEIHEGMILLNDVPRFSGVLLHCFNSADESLGCIGPGEHIIRSPDGNYTIGNSAKAYRRVYPPIRDAIKAGETWIEVRDGIVPLPVVPVPSPIRR